MALKINRIKINNFKVFSAFQDEFENVDLIVFDGPNGFGKTSFYDAFELLITGGIRRYNKLREMIIDGRNTYTENPYLNADNLQGDILIKAELMVDGESLVISRKCLNADIKPETTFTNFKLYKHSGFDDEDGELVSDESEFMIGVFSRDYKENFEFLNYIEQEENVHLLKNTEKDKKTLISHLFNVLEFQNQIDKFEAVRKKLQELCSADAAKELRDKLADLDIHKKNLKEITSTDFEMLFPNAQHVWDQKGIKFSEGIYSVWFGEDGDLLKLKRLIENRPAFIDYKFNKRINEIADATENLSEFLRYGGFIKNKQSLINIENTAIQIEKLLTYFVGLTTYNLDGELLNIPTEVQSLIIERDESALASYLKKLNELRTQRSMASELSRILADLQSARNQLLSKFENYQKLLVSDANENECPLCGYDWSNFDDFSETNSLLANIELQTIALNTVIKDSDDQTTEGLENFIANEAAGISVILTAHLAENTSDEVFIENLKGLDLKTFERREELLTSLGINFGQYFNSSPEMDSPIRLEEFIALLNQQIRPYNPEHDFYGLEEIYNRYFKLNEERFESISVKEIDNKILYIDWQYAIYQNNLIQKHQLEYNAGQLQFDDAKLASEKVKALVDIYKNSLDIYNRTLIRDIEILFHIYSGRIVQDFQGGLGLFIKEDKGIKFLTDPHKSYDAIFSMSSGQLSALMISFTLALNKKYSKNKILFIDDPIQSMDELNIAGFIEVLRNDFYDRQIFISTHEDMMSTYMRYRFEKFNLKTKRVNMKTSLN